MKKYSKLNLLQKRFYSFLRSDATFPSKEIGLPEMIFHNLLGKYSVFEEIVK